MTREYKPDFEKNFKWAIRNGLITESQAREIRAAGPLEETFSGRTVVYEALGRRIFIEQVKNAENVSGVLNYPVFNEKGNYKVSIDTDLYSGGTTVPTECKFRKFGWKRFPTAGAYRDYELRVSCSSSRAA